MLRISVSCGVVVAVFVSSASAQEPKPIKLLLTPAKPPTPALKYQLLPDARLTISGDAVPVYKEAIERLNKTSYKTSFKKHWEQFDAWNALPIDKLPKDEMRKALAEYNEVFAALDKAARCDHCEWGYLERLRAMSYIHLEEITQLRDCAHLLRMRAKLAIAEGDFDKAIVVLRTGFAISRHVGETESASIGFLMGTALASMTASEIGTWIGQPDSPNLYYALTELPTPLISLRKAIQSERFEIPKHFPGLQPIAMNFDAGNMTALQIQESVKVLETVPYVGFDQIKPRTDKERRQLARLILDKHEIAKQALIAAGRPREKVEAMPHFQVALLHGLLECDAVLDEIQVWNNLPYWDQVERLNRLQSTNAEDRANNPNAAALPLAAQLFKYLPHVIGAQGRNDRRIALLRTIEAIRFYAATHDSKLPPNLAAVKEVPLPLDPVTGKSFEYQLDGEAAKLRAPPPGKETPDAGNTVVYELRIRK